MTCHMFQFLDLHLLSKLLQGSVRRAPPRGKTWQRSEQKAQREGGIMRREIRLLSARRTTFGGGTLAQPDS